MPLRGPNPPTRPWRSPPCRSPPPWPVVWVHRDLRKSLEKLFRVPAESGTREPTESSIPSPPGESYVLDRRHLSRSSAFAKRSRPTLKEKFPGGLHPPADELHFVSPKTGLFMARWAYMSPAPISGFFPRSDTSLESRTLENHPAGMANNSPRTGRSNYHEIGPTLPVPSPRPHTGWLARRSRTPFGSARTATVPGNTASLSRTIWESPTTVSWYPPVDVASTRRTTHSASRTISRSPGANVSLPMPIGSGSSLPHALGPKRQTAAGLPQGALRRPLRC